MIEFQTLPLPSESPFILLYIQKTFIDCSVYCTANITLIHVFSSSSNCSFNLALKRTRVLGQVSAGNQSKNHSKTAKSNPTWLLCFDVLNCMKALRGSSLKTGSENDVTLGSGCRHNTEVSKRNKAHENQHISSLYTRTCFSFSHPLRCFWSPAQTPAHCSGFVPYCSSSSLLETQEKSLIPCFP